MQRNLTTAPQLTSLPTATDTNGPLLFAKDVEAGLSLKEKKLSSRYFYDGKGSRLFQQIMHLPEYYLTRTEHAILTTHQEQLARQLEAAGSFQLIDLGAGDATKTSILLKQLIRNAAELEYVPVDISGDALLELSNRLQQELPVLKVHAVQGEYFSALEWISKYKPGRKVLCFMGSNLGNFQPDEQLQFLQRLRSYLFPGDLLLLGIDLCKDPDIILPAYQDAAGVTAAFNLNLLHRINRELGGTFNVDQFKHFALYDPQAAVIKSYLVSRQKQEVHIAATQRHFRFNAWEAIHTESSYKFTLENATFMGQQNGFEVQEVYQDKNCYFADILYIAT